LTLSNPKFPSLQEDHWR